MHRLVLIGIAILLAIALLIPYGPDSHSSTDMPQAAQRAQKTQKPQAEEISPELKTKLCIAAMNYMIADNLNTFKYIGVPKAELSTYQGKTELKGEFVPSDLLVENDEGVLTYKGEWAVSVQITVGRKVKDKYEVHIQYYSAGDGAGSGTILIKPDGDKPTIIDEEPWEIS